MHDYPSQVKEKFDSILKNMAEHHWLYTNDPGHAFMRQHLGKLSFYDTVKMIVGMGKGTTTDEIIDYFDMDPEKIPSQSAFNQRRKQISEYAFQYLFEEFTASFPSITHTFKDHCILACDGCHVVYDTNSQIIEDYNKPRLIDYKGYNHMHLNGFVDVISKTFHNIVIQPGQKPDERQALHDMLNTFNPDNPEKYIVTADRGYESYDLLFHCILKNLFYVFRVKAPSSSTSMLSTYSKELPDTEEEFDVEIKRYFTDKKTSLMKKYPEVYHYMNPGKRIPHFYEALGNDHLIYINFRAVKIKTSDTTYEYLITNLPFSFTIEDLKECYHWRWGIEIAFRYLKHAAGLLHFHSKKPEYLRQEIYATVIMYNLGILLANEAAKENHNRKRRNDNKYLYDIDFSTALRISRKYFIRSTNKSKCNIIQLIMKYVHAVKPQFRQFQRSLRGISAIRFGYR